MPNTLGNRHSTARGALPVTGGTITGNLTVSGEFSADTVTVSGTVEVGSAITAAGISVSGNGNFGGSVGISGDCTVQSLNEGPLAGFRNLLINANPVINQRGYVANTPTTSNNQYTLDRWRVVASGQSLSWADISGVRTVSAPNGGVVQVIESGNNMGGIHTLSWRGTAEATVNTIPVAAGTSVSLPPNTNVTVLFKGGTFALPQLEPGPVATPFERRLVQTELMMCMRYYEKFYAEGLGNGYAPGEFVSSTINYKVQKRIVPTSAVLVSGIQSINAGVGVNDNFTVNGHRFYAQSVTTGGVSSIGVYFVSVEI